MHQLHFCASKIVDRKKKFSEFCLIVHSLLITIDENLEKFRGKWDFRQNILNKPAKYVINIFALVNSRISYTWNIEIYAGTQPKGPYELNNSANE